MTVKSVHAFTKTWNHTMRFIFYFVAAFDKLKVSKHLKSLMDQTVIGHHTNNDTLTLVIVLYVQK